MLPIYLKMYIVFHFYRFECEKKDVLTAVLIKFENKEVVKISFSTLDDQ